MAQADNPGESRDTRLHGRIDYPMSVDDLQPGHHLCCLYDTEDEHRALLTPYLRQGLERGEKVLYIMDVRSAEHIVGYLRDDGLPVEPFIESGQLNVLGIEAAYMREEVFDPDGMIDLLRAETEKAINEGYSALRVTGEMSWALRGLPGSERLIEYEAKLNDFFPGSRCLAICQYDRRGFDPEVLLDILRTHPYVAFGGSIFPNFYYVTPEEYLSPSRPAAELERWLDGLKQRSQAEVALRASEERLRTLFDTMSEGVVLIDPDGQIVQSNPAAERILGLTGPEIAARSYVSPQWEVLRPDGTPMPPEEMASFRAMKERTPVLGLEMQVRRPDGTVSWLNVNATPVLDEAGNVRNVVGTFTDFTDRKLAENGLKLSEQRYALAQQAANIGSWDWNIPSGKLAWSSQIEPLFGFGRGGFPATYEAFLACVHPEDRELVQDAVDAAVRLDKEYDIEHRIVWPDGTVRWVSERGDVLRDAEGKAVRMLGIVQDITERKRLQSILMEERERLEVTLRSTGDGVITTDMDGKVVLLNRIAEQLTGWSQNDAAGRPIGDVFHIIDERNRRRIRNPVHKVLRTGRIIGLTNHILLIAKDGTERVIADSGAPIRDEQGRLYGVVLVFRDITDWRKMEEDLTRMDRLESLGVLAGGIAHDFNNFLGAILGNVSLARRQLEPREDLCELLTEAESACLRAKALSQQLLTFARGGAPVRRLANLGDLVRESAGLASRGSNVRCDLSIPDDLWMAEVDAGQIDQVISNLIINAIQAMPHGGTVRIGARNTVISKRTGAVPLGRGEYLKITVADEGIGIPTEHVERVFDPYFSTKQKGSGLGLAVAYSIVKKHDGYIGVESSLGRGTVFSVYLPAVKVSMPAETARETRPPTRGRGRVLVMDDDESMQKMLGKTLTLLGYEVEATSDGVEAVRRYTEAMGSGRPFGAVVLDLTVPGGMGGKEAVERLIEADPGVRAIVSSGYSADPIMADFRKYGFTDVVAKPYSIEQLDEVLDRALREE